MAGVSLSSINPLGAVKLGSMSTMASILIIIGIVVVILGLAGFLIFIKVVKKQFYIRIKVFKKVGNIPTCIANYVCREVPMGMAGDKLWRVAPNSALQMAFKVIKWLPVGMYQTDRNEFWYYIREDGEWINFIQSDIDDISRKMHVKFVQEDMRLQRLATDRLLEQRLMNKSFWDKWGNTIMTIILFLVIAVSIVIIFFQFSKLLDKMQPLVEVLTRSLEHIDKVCPAMFSNSTSTGGGTGLIPAQ